MSDHVEVLRHVTVYHESGRYGGWPANHGIWTWGDEFLVGFQVGDYKEHAGHTIDWERPIRKVFARSRDGGGTWTLEDTLPDALDNLMSMPGAPITSQGRVTSCPGGIDFTHPDFVMTFSHASFHVGPSRFWTSCDRGHTWNGPYGLPDMGTPGIAARTDYLVNGPSDCLLFLTTAKADLYEGRPFCARTTDGGRTWVLVSWIGAEPPSGFVIMPASVRLPGGDIVVTLRAQPDKTHSSISAYLSSDNGITWQRLPDPVPDLAPSNPPALIRLHDGRLCLTYGVRAEPFRICARLSHDRGRTWSDEIVLRADGANWDIGYTRSVQRSDGAIVTVYYFNDARTGPERYIGATIWKSA
jgi:BNR repeat-like domain